MQVVLFGADLKPVNRPAFMPAFGGGLSDAKIAAVSTYVIGHFGGKAGRMTPKQVAKARAAGLAHRAAVARRPSRWPMRAGMSRGAPAKA